MGRSDHVRSDAHHPEIFIEVKNKKVYTAVVDHLKDVRKEAEKIGQVGFLNFPEQGTVAAHSSDLVKMALSMTIPGEGILATYESVATEVPKLRKSFKDFADAQYLAEEEGQGITVLAFKKPKIHGFVLLAKMEQIVDITRWHVAGQYLINTILNGAGRDELRPDITEEMRMLYGLDSIVVDYLQKLTKFKHHWQVPKRKKLNVKKKNKRSRPEGTQCGDDQDDTPDWVNSAVESAQSEPVCPVARAD